ncbi:hypothetical protein OMP43_17775 [Sphingomonas sp. CBMAI 2297]|uniref:hypothetical protein n=1 Tax=Sphingomonas sp. CBMAI 2297 TaxID=2991720 RepID=UPI002458EC56|nr:hypothetical protein [Sphingomonas sp. CBMAI 2297]MDH4745878.1 hypothetical protein [Sphingomonas sp. CBMAI 2297]
MQTLLDAARQRGQEATGFTVLPPGLDKFTAYVGLIGSALELGKLVATEERDLTAIHTHHGTTMAEISAAFHEIETAMLADFTRDESLKEKTFDAINRLIEAGQYEIASEFHKRLLEGSTRPSLEAIIERRRMHFDQTGVTLRAL